MLHGTEINGIKWRFTVKGDSKYRITISQDTFNSAEQVQKHDTRTATLNVSKKNSAITGTYCTHKNSRGRELNKG